MFACILSVDMCACMHMGIEYIKVSYVVLCDWYQIDQQKQNMAFENE